MAKLTAAQRRRLPKSAFALPSTRRYPIHTRGHAISALGRMRREPIGRQRYIRSRIYKRYPGLKP